MTIYNLNIILADYSTEMTPNIAAEERCIINNPVTSSARTSSSVVIDQTKSQINMQTETVALHRATGNRGNFPSYHCTF